MNDDRTMTMARPSLLLIPFVLAAVTFYVLAVDQGLLLALVQGDLAYEINLIHEFVHDARHTAGFPCH